MTTLLPPFIYNHYWICLVLILSAAAFLWSILLEPLIDSTIKKLAMSLGSFTLLLIIPLTFLDLQIVHQSPTEELDNVPNQIYTKSTPKIKKYYVTQNNKIITKKELLNSDKDDIDLGPVYYLVTKDNQKITLNSGNLLNNNLVDVKTKNTKGKSRVKLTLVTAGKKPKYKAYKRHLPKHQYHLTITRYRHIDYQKN